LTGHLRDRVRIELESVFEGIDSGVDPDPCPDKETGVRRDLRAATVREFDDGPHVFRRPGRLLLLRSVEVELEEVRPVVELRRCGLQEGGAIICLDREAPRQDAAVADPRSGDPDPRSIQVRLPPCPHAKGEGPPPSVPRIHGERGSDVAGPAHARAAQEVPVVLRHLEQFLGRIGAAVDPVRAAGKRDVAVRIDHPRDDRRAARVDHADVRGQVAFIGRGTHPDDAAIVHEDAHAFPQGRSRPIRKGGVPIECGAMRGHWARDVSRP